MENPFDFAQASYGDLLVEAKRLNDEVTSLQNKMMFVEKAFANRDRQVMEAKALIEEMVTEGEITDEDYIQKLAEVLNLDITRTVTVDVTITGTITLELPYKENPDEISEYAFSVELSSYDYDVQEYDLSIDEISLS
mgnify:CR=1 FL=1